MEMDFEMFVLLVGLIVTFFLMLIGSSINKR